jgi:glycosyltransferase involved in cell wall biosynthesis
VVSDEVVPDIAVIVPTRNRCNVLPQAIESVFDQSHHNFELVVVDDCSQDDTAAYLAAISDSRLRWHRFDHWRRGNAARNHAAALSRAPILSFLDSDDRFLRDRLSSDLAFFADNPGVDVRISSFTSVTNSSSSPRKNPEAIFAREEFERYLVGYGLHLGGSGIAVRRRAFDDVGGFDETLIRMQDRDLLLRLARTRGCASTSKINWVKTRSADSISHQLEGQIDALSELSRRHPALRERYPEFLRYLVAREIISPLVQGRLGQARKALIEAWRNPDLETSIVQLIPDYLRGKRRRADLKLEILRRFDFRMD